MRALGIDLGTRRTGVALAEGNVAVPLETITRIRKLSDLVRRVARLGEHRGVDCFVVGLPLQTDGEAGERAAYAHSFATKLRERTTKPVHLVDERYTSVEAEARLQGAGVRGEKLVAVLDQTAAVIILETWLSGQDQSA